MIISYRCDVPMAEKKGIMGRCDKRCRECMCAIRKNEWGQESHVSDHVHGECSNLTVRNIEVMSGRKRK